MQGRAENIRQAKIACSSHLNLNHPLIQLVPKRKHVLEGLQANTVPTISLLSGDRQAGLVLTSRDDAWDGHTDP